VLREKVLEIPLVGAVLVEGRACRVGLRVALLRQPAIRAAHEARRTRRHVDGVCRDENVEAELVDVLWYDAPDVVRSEGHEVYHGVPRWLRRDERAECALPSVASNVPHQALKGALCPATVQDGQVIAAVL
jgi:hypothetical protein